MSDSTDNSDKPHGSQRPGGRTAVIGNRVASCVLNFLQAGQTEFTVADIAEATGIHRSTIYRRWPSREALLREGIKLHANSIPVPNNNHWQTDLEQLCRALAIFAADPVELAILRSMMQPQQLALSVQISEQWQPQLEQQAMPIVQAQQRGEINASLDPQMLLSMIISPLLMQSLLNDGDVPDEFVTTLFETVLQLTTSTGT